MRDKDSIILEGIVSEMYDRPYEVDINLEGSSQEELVNNIKKIPQDIFEKVDDEVNSKLENDPELSEIELPLNVIVSTPDGVNQQKVLKMIKQVIGLAKDEYGLSDFGNVIMDENEFGFDVKYYEDLDDRKADAADYADMQRDPYAYHGVSRSDFWNPRR